MTELMEPSPAVKPREMTRRQRQVIERIALGDSFREAAEALGMSQRTIEKHVAVAKLRLGARSLAQAAVLAVRGGYIRV